MQRLTAVSDCELQTDYRNEQENDGQWKMMNDAVIDGLFITVGQTPHIWEQRENGKA